MNAQQTKDLTLLLGEYNTLSGKVKHTKTEEHRMAFLQTAISAVKAGANLQDLDEQYVNQVEERNGLPITKFERSHLNVEQRAEARAFQGFAKGEQRADTGGSILNRLGTYSGLGFFVPTNFMQELFTALKAADCLMNEDDCTLIKTMDGRVITVPTLDDTTHDATVIGTDPGSTSEVDIADPNQAVLPVYSYASRRWTTSLESFDDLQSSFTAYGLFREFMSKSLSRGIGRDLAVGNGTNRPHGLVPSIIAAGAPVVTASGSAANTGNGEDGTNSVGSADLANMLAQLDSAYLNSPKCAFVMNKGTLAGLRALVSKMGTPLDLVKDIPGVGPTIYGVRVKIAPSFDSVGVSKQPIVLGDLSYWISRLVLGGADDIGVKRYVESAGLAENGLVAFRSFVRAGGTLAWNGASSASSPFVVLQGHS